MAIPWRRWWVWVSPGDAIKSAQYMTSCTATPCLAVLVLSTNVFEAHTLGWELNSHQEESSLPVWKQHVSSEFWSSVTNAMRWHIMTLIWAMNINEPHT
jgi:hypothetical protein